MRLKSLSSLRPVPLPHQHSWETPASAAGPCRGKRAPGWGDTAWPYYQREGGEVWAGGTASMLDQGQAAWTSSGSHLREPILAPSVVGDRERAWRQAVVRREASRGSLLLLLPPLPFHPHPRPCPALQEQQLLKPGLGRGSPGLNQSQPKAERSETQTRGAEIGPVAHFHLSWPFLWPQGQYFCPALASELHKVWFKNFTYFLPKTDSP